MSIVGIGANLKPTHINNGAISDLYLRSLSSKGKVIQITVGLYSVSNKNFSQILVCYCVHLGVQSLLTRCGLMSEVRLMMTWLHYTWLAHVRKLGQCLYANELPRHLFWDINQLFSHGRSISSRCLGQGLSTRVTVAGDHNIVSITCQFHSYLF